MHSKDLCYYDNCVRDEETCIVYFTSHDNGDTGQMTLFLTSMRVYDKIKMQIIVPQPSAPEEVSIWPEKSEA